MNTKSTAKDFFLHVSVIALLYARTIALLNILFSVINEAFPQVTKYGYYGTPSISFPVATLIVVFPLFLFLANLLYKGYQNIPELKEYAVRKWLIYITLFIAGGVLAGDLVVLIYFFLDGQELSSAFILKILSVLVVMGVIFGYYIDDLKDRLTGSRRMIWRVVALILVVGTVVAGFSVLGTPQSQRTLRYDNEKVSDLQNIQSQILYYWQQKEELPNAIEDLQDPITGFRIPLDPQTNEPYEFEKTGNLSFNLCAEFNNSAEEVESRAVPRVDYNEPASKIGENWQHDAGRVCFSRTIDPKLHEIKR